SFAAAPLSVSEGTGFVRLTVTRSGDLSLPARVDYATSGGTADDRADFTAAYGTLRFAADETTRTLDVFVTDDRFAEGPESFTVALSNAAGVTLGAAPTATVHLLDHDAATGANPVRWDAGVDTQFFVRQHYVDFFNREPDAAGLAHWTNVIESCGADNLCREARRVNVSAAFVLSIEFQETGFVVYLAHQAAFETAERLRLKDFLADVREIGRGVVVNQGDWKGQIESNRTAFFDEFVTRPAFASKFGALSNVQYVDALNAGAGNSLTQGERDALVAGLNAATLTRARALRSVVENPAFGRSHYNRAFVLMQYFGSLRRNPDDAPEQNRDFAGFNHWLTNLNNFNGNFEQAEMVKAFITSEEYQRRFGP
ncbi:MAG TPA: Calx-beta domain-containing protein, partial [Pyrinomonadaceae bacterium]|nr:Calx-beta domain-containing protein [Pyrinomonadaceae bacterium]